MADLLADIETLELRIQRLVQRSYRSPALTRWNKGLVESILSVLSKYKVEDLSKADLADAITKAITDSGIQMTKDLQVEIARMVKQLVGETQRFYEAQGEDVADLMTAVRRSDQSKSINRYFTESMKAIRGNLAEKSIEVFTEAIKKGAISRKDIEMDIARAAVTNVSYARVQTQALISGYNQVARNEVQKTTTIGHGFYYGKARKNTRLFCLECIGKTFKIADIEKMRNGMLEPVKINRGGYRCIHSWLWVRPEWDKRFKVVDGEPVKLIDGGHSIIVIRGEQQPVDKPDVNDKSYLIKDRSRDEIRRGITGVFKKHGITVDVARISNDLSVDDINRRLVELDVLLTEFNLKPARTKLAELGIMRPDVSMAGKPGEYNGVVRHYPHNGQVIEIDVGKVGTSDRYWAYYNREPVLSQKTMSGFEAIRSIGSSKCDKERLHEMVVTHEFMHFIDSSRHEPNSPFWKEMWKIQREYQDEKYIAVRGKRVADSVDFLANDYLGKYADENIDEFAAEAFSQFRNSTNPGKWATKVHELVKKYYGRSK